MGDISTGLIEFAEHKRLLFERIRHKLGDMNLNKKPNDPHIMSAILDITDEVLSSLYIESAEIIELHIGLLDLTIADPLKMKWIGLHTTALAKEVVARVRYCAYHSNGAVSNEWQLTEYKLLLKESKEEREDLITLFKENKKVPNTKKP